MAVKSDRSRLRQKSAARAKADSTVVEPLHVLEVRHRMGLSQDKFSRIVGIKVRTLSKLEQGETPSEQVSRQIREVDRLQQALATVVDEKAISAWMQAPNVAFNGLKPIEVIERGEIDRLWAMIYDLRSGSPL